LARLREETEPLIEEERRQALRALLQHPLLLPEGPTATAFALARRHQDFLADWFAHHADWRLLATAEAVRLRKQTASAGDGTRGAVEPAKEEPFQRSRYVLFCLAVAALERGGRQVTLGRLAEHVLVSLTADPVFAAHGFLWSLDHASGRRDFVNVLRLLVALGVLRRVQGDEERLLHDRESDALYNVSRPVLALLLVVARSPSLITASDFAGRLAALLENPRPDTPDARNRALRTGFARRLLDDPVLYYEDLDDEQRAYLDRQRGFLLPELAKATGLHVEVRSEGIALVDLEGDCTDSGLPEEGTEGHLTLLLATWLAGRLRSGDSGAVSLETFRQQTARLVRQHRHHWRREVQERGAEIWLADLVLKRLAGLALVELTPDGLRARPALGRFALRPTAELAPAPEQSDLPFDS
jgi:uncharacterized protein (TIGR02678 family)